MTASAHSTDAVTEIFSLPWQQIQRRWLRVLLHYTHHLLEWALGLHILQHIYRNVRAQPTSIPFPRRVLEEMHTTHSVTATDCERIPQKGSLVILANHPFGATEGIALLDLLLRYRPDVKVLGNFILKRIPELHEYMFFVDPFGRADSANRNVNALRHARQWLHNGHALIIFPAGEVASFESEAFRIRDAKWHTSTLTLLRLASNQLSILPVYIPGTASLLFHFVGKIHPRLRTMLLPREMLRLRRHSLTLRIGTPIQSQMLFQRFTNDEEAMRYLRFRIFLLEGRQRQSWIDYQMQRLTLDTTERVDEPVIPPVPPDRLEAELASLPPEATLFTTEEHILYAVQGAHIPITLPEIGRLRELTFRAAGEGTGHTSDTDDFDHDYYQIILWSKYQRHIVGCYRLALSDKLVEEKGLNALYTRTLFQYDERFLGHLSGPAIELGRSFVRPSHQRTFAPLLLLWRGVLTFIARHPHYTTLFGPVSISHDFSEAASTLLLEYLKQNAYDANLARWVSARLPPKCSSSSEWQHADYAIFRRSENEINQLLSEIENMPTGIPILIRQYMKLGGKIVAFNVDPDFGTAIDGLIVVDLLEASPRDISRYMGKSLYEAYCNAQQKENS